MKIIRFRSNSEHSDILKKVKKMRKFAADLEECLVDMVEDDDDDLDFRHEDEDDEEYVKVPKSKFYRKAKKSRM